MGTLRHYFPTQRELHATLVQRVLDDTIHDFDIQDATLDAGDRLSKCMLQFLPEDAEAESLLDVWFGLYRHALEPRSHSMAASFLEVSVRRSQARMTAWLEQLATEGAIDRDRVPESVLLLAALVSGMCLEILTPGSGMRIGIAREMLARTARALVAEEKA